MDLSKQYDVLVEAIIRPPRVEYEPEDLGDPNIRLGSRVFRRDDFELTNPRGLKFFCSMYAPVVRPRRLPCVIFCHGNGGCRLDAAETLRTLLPMNIMVVTLDFSGCGLSEGEYISLGYFEKEDVSVLVKHLRELDVTTRIALWGRSMGAVIAIQSAQADPSLACIVADSPFSTLNTLANELVSHFDVSVPGLMIKLVFKMVRNSVKKRAKFDIKKLDNLKAAQEAFVPALFGHADEDDFIAPSHTIALQAVYAGDSNKVIFGGDHNSTRPPFFLSSVSIFFRNHLLIASDFGENNPIPNGQTMEEYFAVVGGGDSMRMFERIPMHQNGSDTEDSAGDYDMAIAVPRQVPRKHTEDEMLARAIALSLAEGQSGSVPQNDDEEEDSDLAAALALSAAEAKKERPHKGEKSPVGDLRNGNGSSPRTSKENSGDVVSPRSRDKKEREKEKEREREREKEKEKEKKKSKRRSLSVAPPLDIAGIQKRDSDSEDISPHPSAGSSKKDKKKSKDKSSVNSSHKKSSGEIPKEKSSPKPTLTPISSASNTGELDNHTIGLEDSEDADLQAAISMSAATTPPRTKKKK